MESLLRAGLIGGLVLTVFGLAITILLAVVSTLVYASVRKAWDVAHGWRSVICPPRDRTAEVHIRSGAVVGCTLFGERAPTCAHPCLPVASHAR